MRLTVDLATTRRELRHQFALWDIDPSEFEVVWENELNPSAGRLAPGVQVLYLRNTIWQQISCYTFTTRANNLRQVFLLIQRLRIAEQQGVQYQGLTFTRDVVKSGPDNNERDKKEVLLDAYDVVGVSPDDPIDMVKEIYTRKAQRYHPDHGGDVEKFTRLDEAYTLIIKSRG